MTYLQKHNEKCNYKRELIKNCSCNKIRLLQYWPRNLSCGLLTQIFLWFSHIKLQKVQTIRFSLSQIFPFLLSSGMRNCAKGAKESCDCSMSDVDTTYTIYHTGFLFLPSYSWAFVYFLSLSLCSFFFLFCVFCTRDNIYIVLFEICE